MLMSTRVRENMEQKYEEDIKLLQEEIETCEAEQEECLRALTREHKDTLQNVLWVEKTVWAALSITPDPLHPALLNITTEGF